MSVFAPEINTDNEYLRTFLIKLHVAELLRNFITDFKYKGKTISMTYDYLAMFAVHTHSHFTITHQRIYNTMIFPCGSTVRSPVPIKNSLPYYNQLSAMPSLFMFLDTSSSTNGTMDGWSFTSSNSKMSFIFQLSHK